MGGLPSTDSRPRARNPLLEVDAAEIRIRAEPRLGELIRAQKDSVGLSLAGTRLSGSKQEPVRDVRPTLAEAGIDKKLSSRAQKLTAFGPEPSVWLDIMINHSPGGPWALRLRS